MPQRASPILTWTRASRFCHIPRGSPADSAVASWLVVKMPITQHSQCYVTTVPRTRVRQVSVRRLKIAYLHGRRSDALWLKFEPSRSNCVNGPNALLAESLSWGIAHVAVRRRTRVDARQRPASTDFPARVGAKLVLARWRSRAVASPARRLMRYRRTGDPGRRNRDRRLASGRLAVSEMRVSARISIAPRPDHFIR